MWVGTNQESGLCFFSGSIPFLNYLNAAFEEPKLENWPHWGQHDWGKQELDEASRRHQRHEERALRCSIDLHHGGQGLNIQLANRLIVFDYVFNPQLESQAIARSYRIGQGLNLDTSWTKTLKERYQWYSFNKRNGEQKAGYMCVPVAFDYRGIIMKTIKSLATLFSLPAFLLSSCNLGLSH